VTMFGDRNGHGVPDEGEGVDERVEQTIAMHPDRIVASYRRKFGLPVDASVTPKMVRLHWEIERRGTKAILASSEQERAAATGHAYTELYARCPWLNQYAVVRDDPGVEFRGLLALLGPGRRIYEIGSGKGRLIRWLAQNAYSCVGTEITSQRGSKHVAEAVGLEWHTTDGVNLMRYENAASYDAVISIQVLEHIHPDDVPAHLRSVATLLKSEGKYIFTTPHRYSGPADLSAVFGLDRAVCHHLKEWTFGELVPLLRQAGFADIRAVYTPPLSLRRRVNLLNSAFATAVYLKLLLLLESLHDRLPSWLGSLLVRAMRVSTLLRNDIYMTAAKLER
jgi:SAM-dependent methyltransferase